MRHGHGLRKLNRTSSHRLAMLKNMMNSLIEHEAIKTTVPKAKELRRVIEPMITLAKVDTVANRRLAFDRLRDRDSVIMGSITRRSSLALGTVVLMASCSMSEFIMFFSIARRCEEVRLSLRRP